MLKWTILWLAALCCIAGLWQSAMADGQPVDLALVLAVDASGSVDDGEFALQLAGIAAGFRDPVFRQAMKSGPEGRIAVMLLVWADHQYPKDRTRWFTLALAEDAEAFARLVETFPRYQNGATGIGEGIAAALRAIDSSGFKARRKVVDVSGDGRASRGGIGETESQQALARQVAGVKAPGWRSCRNGTQPYRRYHFSARRE